MKLVTLTFGKDKTAIIKGFAIVFMIILHCGDQGWYSETIPAFSTHSTLPRYFSIFKLCVGIFTFMVGLGYAFAKKKDLRYSFTHIKKLLFSFWTILFVFTVPVIIAKGEWRGFNFLLLNAFGINSEWNWTSWFVAFFIYAMIVMPFISRIIDKKPIVGASAMILLTYGIGVIIHEVVPNYSSNDWTQRLFDCMLTSPTMILGYLFAHERWFCKVKVPKHWSMVSLSILLVIAVFVMRFFLGAVAAFNFDFFYAPLFIFAILVIFNLCRLPLLTKVMTTLGNVSVYMWFFHALFFTGVVRSTYQPFIMVSHSLFIIVPWTILLTFCCSWVIKKTVNKGQQMIVKNKKI